MIGPITDGIFTCLEMHLTELSNPNVVFKSVRLPYSRIPQSLISVHGLTYRCRLKLAPFDLLTTVSSFSMAVASRPYWFQAVEPSVGLVLQLCCYGCLLNKQLAASCIFKQSNAWLFARE